MLKLGARPITRWTLAGTVVLIACNMAAATVARCEDSPKQTFVAALQIAIRSDDKNWLAAHMSYPVRFFGKRRTTIPSKAAFLAGYSSFMGPKLKAVVLAQDPGDVFENWQGAMVGDGSHNIWITQVGDATNAPYQIITINDAE